MLYEVICPHCLSTGPLLAFYFWLPANELCEMHNYATGHASFVKEA